MTKKSLFILIVISFFSSFVNGQTLTIKDMIEQANCIDINCFNNFILKKGFIFQHKKEFTTNKEIGYVFISKERFAVEDSLRNNEVLIEFKNGKFYDISFTTEVKEHYESMLNQLQNFRFIGNEHAMNNDRSFTYTSELYKNIYFHIIILEPKSTKELGKIDIGSVNRYIITINTYSNY